MNNKKFNILTIDDDESFNLKIINLLQNSEYKVLTTTCVKEFIEQFIVFKPDLCILDVNIQNKFGAGLQLLKVIRSKISKEIPVIVISKMNSDQNITQALENGASDFLPKPLDDISLMQKLKILIPDSQLGKSSFPHFIMSEGYRDCRFHTQFALDKIDEFSISFYSSHQISRGTPIILSGEILRDCIGQESFNSYVTKCVKMVQNDRYYISVNFPEENSQLSTHVRKWLIDKA